MACTRFKNDKMAIEIGNSKNLLASQYMLNVPGNGTTPPYIEDPQIRLQKFGANISSRIIDVNTNLLGINRKIGRDCGQKSYDNCEYSRIQYPVKCGAVTDESRTMMPAWEIRDLEANRWNFLHINPQENTERSFENNISSRLLEKDNYIPELPNIN